MSQSLSKVYVHIIFSTKNIQPTIDDTIEDSLFGYIGGTCKGLDCNPIKVGGYRDHVHVLCQLSRKITQMKLLEEIKKQSSKWIKPKGKAYSNFYWQDACLPARQGYGIFSVNPADIDIVAAYIAHQREHHKKTTFKEEFRAFLKKYHVDYDERYVWD
jgi:putative transposase